MKKLTIAGAAALAILATACSGHKSSDICNLSIAVNDPSLNGSWAYIQDYDNGAKTDSAIVENDSVHFALRVEKPYIARLILGGNRAGMFIAEKGTLSQDSLGNFTGTPLNATFTAAMQRIDRIGRQASELPSDSAGMAKGDSLQKVYDTYVDSLTQANIDNPIGYFFFLSQAYMMDHAQLEEALRKAPGIASYQRITDLLESLRLKAETMPGSKYKDFEVPTDSVAVKLSSFVGVDGKFTLVDFWASWCGPCRREIPVIKNLAEQFAADLNVVGVAVWDEPANTRKAIQELGITWPVIIDAQKIPTDIYGISGIPCIILIAPDGTIVSRDATGDDLVSQVTQAINDAKAAREAETTAP